MKPAEYLQQQINKSTNATHIEQWQKLETFFNRKLWHQLTEFLKDFVYSDVFQSGGLVQLYEDFLSEIASRLDTLSYAKLLLVVSTQLESPEAALAFLSNKQDEMKDNKLAQICLRCAVAELQLRLELATDCKKTLEETEQYFDDMDGVTEMHATYYRVSAEYFKICGDFDNFYTDALRYLGCIDHTSLSLEEQVQRAFDLGLAALLSHSVYNFGELLNHQILETLKATEKNWLIDLLFAFNSGDVKAVEQLSSQWQTQPDLVANTSNLKQKASLLAVMEMVFKAPASNRCFKLQDIASVAQVQQDQVELLVMKALSLGLVKGYIDQVDQVAILPWVQPRVLNIDQVKTMKTRFDEWIKTVKSTVDSMKTTAPDLFVHTQ